MFSNKRVINSTSLPLIYGISMPLTAYSSATDNSSGNGFAELLQYFNSARLWAPSAFYNSDSPINTSLVTNSSDNSNGFNSSLQLVDCLSSVKCLNWINYTDNDSNRNQFIQRGVDPIKTIDTLSTFNISSNRGPDYVLDNETISSTTFTYLSIDYSNLTLDSEVDLRIHHPFLAVFLAIICVVVVFGNTLTMLSVYRERYLHTVTNYFVASLAVSDCLVGAIVMPFSVIHEIMNKWWIFGQDWCDLWHSFDVLASSASILNLCVISLDRYWAITDPITYPSRMTPNKAVIFIAFLWFCSALISFPAILWWRAVQKEPSPPFRCLFTDDVGYLVFSSTISFYGPLTVMVFTYAKIYFIASKQTRSLKLGAKQIQSSSCDTGNNNAITLRMHKGGYNTGIPRHKYSGDSSDDHNPDFGGEENGLEKCGSIRSSRHMKNNWSVGRRLAKLAKERKAAKTLGIVMGVFILCWLPFFVTNILMGICQSCVYEPDLLLSVVTWLGWINSALNPVIYACWSRDFRRAFAKILCSCCTSAQKRRQNLVKQNRFNSLMARDGKHTKRKSTEEVVLNSLEVIQSHSYDRNRHATNETIPL